MYGWFRSGNWWLFSLLTNNFYTKKLNLLQFLRLCGAALKYLKLSFLLLLFSTLFCNNKRVYFYAFKAVFFFSYFAGIWGYVASDALRLFATALECMSVYVVSFSRTWGCNNPSAIGWICTTEIFVIYFHVWGYVGAHAPSIFLLSLRMIKMRKSQRVQWPCRYTFGNIFNLLLFVCG